MSTALSLHFFSNTSFACAQVVGAEVLGRGLTSIEMKEVDAEFKCDGPDGMLEGVNSFAAGLSPEPRPCMPLQLPVVLMSSSCLSTSKGVKLAAEASIEP